MTTGIRGNGFLEVPDDLAHSLFESQTGVNNILKALIDIVPAGLIFADVSGAIVLANSAANSILGGQVTVDVFGPSSGYTLRWPDGSMLGREEFPLLISLKKGEVIKEKEIIVHFENGKQIVLLVSSSPMYNKSGVIMGSVAIFQDVTLQKTYKRIIGASAIVHGKTGEKCMEEVLAESELRFKTVFDNAAVGIALISVEGRFLKVNRSLCETLGYSEQEILSLTFHSITHPDYLEEELAFLNKLLHGEMRSYSMEKRLFHKLGQTVWVLLSVALIRDHHGEPMYFVAQVQDITKRKEVEEELKSAKREAEIARERAERLASTDYLTGILNRRAFMNRLNEEFERMKREKTSLGLIIADIDHFKRINDTFGHQAGDMALQKFVQCLLSVCRHYDIIGRYGGEEFIICLPSTSRHHAEKIAERMRIAVQKPSNQSCLQPGAYKDDLQLRSYFSTVR